MDLLLTPILASATSLYFHRADKHIIFFSKFVHYILDQRIRLAGVNRLLNLFIDRIVALKRTDCVDWYSA